MAGPETGGSGGRTDAAASPGRGAVIWLTGLPGAGKTTLAGALAPRLRTHCGAPVMTLDGDAMRAGLCADLGFSREDRAENVRRVAEVAALLAHAGIICIAALISPFAADRATARRIVTRRAGVSFVEVFVDAPLDCCRDRDPKGLYRDARLGKVSRLTGVSDPYEAPVSPELQVRTDVMSVDACADLVCARVVQLFV